MCHENVLRFKHIPISIGQCKGNEFQTLPNGHNFGSWNPSMFWIFGTKMHMVNEVQIELLTYHWNVWKIDIENELEFSIWNCELGIMVKKVGSNQIGNLIFGHKIF
jgi:hypothetical protein